MGTRGAMGVRIDGTDKITYNHFDSYPEGLGDSMVGDVRKLLVDPGLDGLRALARSLAFADKSRPPTEAEKQRLRKYADLGVGKQSLDDWYCLTRNLQGKFALTLKAGLMSDDREFMRDSLFCEYAYIVNLDTESFEVYRGFQHAKHDKGRYADLPQTERPGGRENEYWPVALVAEFPLSDIPQDWAQRAFPSEDEE